MTWNWTHKSLEPRPEYSVCDGLVLKGSTIVAYLRPRGRLVSISGEVIGLYESPAHAMLIAMRYHEQLNHQHRTMRDSSCIDPA